MPFKSRSQQGLFFAASGSKKWKKGKRPKISLSTAKKWAKETKFKKLPQKVTRRRHTRRR